jgi:hypothetical protein
MWFRIKTTNPATKDRFITYGIGGAITLVTDPTDAYISADRDHMASILRRCARTCVQPNTLEIEAFTIG